MPGENCFPRMHCFKNSKNQGIDVTQILLENFDFHSSWIKEIVEVLG